MDGQRVDVGVEIDSLRAAHVAPGYWVGDFEAFGAEFAVYVEEGRRWGPVSVGGEAYFYEAEWVEGEGEDLKLQLFGEFNELGESGGCCGGCR